MGHRDHHTSHGATCPFCTLLCTDLPPTVLDDTAAVACPRARGAYERVAAERAGAPQVDGKDVDLDTAVARAAELLQGAELPLFAGAGGDVGALRALLDLAEGCGGVVDHLHGEAMARSLRIFQSSGWMSAGFGELRQLADLVVVLDGDVLSRHPRLVERFIAGGDTVHAGHERPPKVIVLGGPAPTLPDGLSVHHVPCALPDLADALGVLSCLLYDRPLPATPPPVPIDSLRELLAHMREARYGMVLWAADSFAFEHGDLTMHIAAELTAEINFVTRFTGLPLAPGDGGASLQQVASWKCGFPLRMAFRESGPLYDPYHHAAERMLAGGGADVLVWLSSFGHHPVPDTERPTVVLARPDDPARERAAVFIPVGVPGIDHGGFMFRGDGPVAIPAGTLRDIGLPSAGAVLGAIHQRWAQEVAR